ncbi:hypothetical protein [Nitrosophilus alvini]|uniref:hypothetical protein n=1 Tax=Nitrosophilus alvini TaxID=2714855 RepID=UPI00190BA3B9|nr:hypothetical protein [Nitrosophilus alvini]
MAIKLTQQDIDWILDRYPNMEYDKSVNEIFGELSFKRKYQETKVFDAYNVRIFFNDIDSHTKLPKVICECDKVQKIAQKYKIDTTDLHINTNGSFCLTIQGDEHIFFTNGFTIQEFFKNAVEGFLFQLSYFDRYGSFPWGEYAHGYLGHIEKFASGFISIQDLFERLTKEELAKVLLTNRQSKCLCGKGKKLRNCHPLVFKGINRMKKVLYS